MRVKDGREGEVHIHTYTHTHLPGEVRNGMSDIVVRHSENRELRDGAVPAHNTPCSLVDGGKIRVPVCERDGG